MTSSVNCDAHTDDADETLNSATPPLTERGSTRRPDRPTTLSRPVQLPACCNFRRQPWRTYVHGEFSYAAAPRCYSGVDDELGAAADNDAVVRIIESLQINDKPLCCSNGYHGDDINNPGVRKPNDGSDNCVESKENSDQTDSNDRIPQNAPKSSPIVAAVQITTVPLSSNAEDTHCGNGIMGVNGTCVSNDSYQNGDHSERSATQQMKQDINQNLRPIDGAKHAAGVVPETKCHTGTGNSRQRPESPKTGRQQQKSKSRRSRNRSLASRDERLTNGDAEHQNKHGGRKSARSRTLSPALAERFDYHVSRPVQTEPCRPEVARCDGFESSAVCFRPGAHRNGRSAAYSLSGKIDNRVVTSSPPQPHRSALRLYSIPTNVMCSLLYFAKRTCGVITPSVTRVRLSCSGFIF